MAFGSGQYFEEGFEDFEEDEQPLLGPKLTTSSRLSISSTHSLASTLARAKSEQIDTQTHGIHKHYLPPSWYFRDSKNAGSTLDGADPDMNPQMFKLLARYSRRLHILKPKTKNDKRLLSNTYEHERDLSAVSSDETKICLVQSKRNGQDRERFAVKVFVRHPRFHHTSVKLYTRRVTTEFRLAHTLTHLNVVRVLDLLHNERGDLCQVMEYCDGGSLLDLLHQVNWLVQDEANCLLKQLLQAVQYIHSLGVAHRNLKPENILLTGKGVLKITDFSCAECFRRPWMMSSMDHDVPRVSSGLKGTVPYIAPEQFKDTKFDPAKGDVWAVGIIYFAMRSGRLPWKRATSDDPLYHKYTRDVQCGRGNKYIDWVSGERCRDMLYSILQPDVKSRHTASQALDSPGSRGIKLCY